MKYFAYGSNMNLDQMRDRCPDSVLMGKAVLQDYKIAFTIFSPKRNCGCADIVASDGDEVWGLVYEISLADLAKLDKAEGHPVHYKRFQVSIEDAEGKNHLTETYQVVTKQAEFIKPSQHYLGLMQKAASDFAFPDTYQSLLYGVETSD